MMSFQSELRREASLLHQLISSSFGRGVWADRKGPSYLVDGLGILYEAPKGIVRDLLIPTTERLQQEVGLGIKTFLLITLKLLLQPWDYLPPPPHLSCPTWNPSSEEELRNILLGEMGEELAKGLATAFWNLGEDSILSLEDDPGLGLRMVQENGYEIDCGPESISSLGSSEERILDGPLVAAVPMILHKVSEVQELLEVASQFKSPLALFSYGIFGDARKTILLNDKKQVISCVPIRAGGTYWRKRSILEDICAFTGATLLDPVAHSLQKIDPSIFGGAKKISIRKNQTRILMPSEERPQMDSYLERLQTQALNAESSFEKQWIERRKSMIQGGLCILHVGAPTESERRWKKAQIEKGICLLRSGITHGFTFEEPWRLLASVTAEEPWKATLLEPARSIARLHGQTIEECLSCPRDGRVTSIHALRLSLSMAYSVATELRNTAVKIRGKSCRDE